MAAVLACEVIQLVTGHVAARIAATLSNVLFTVPWLMCLDVHILADLAKTAVAYYYSIALVLGRVGSILLKGQKLEGGNREAFAANTVTVAIALLATFPLMVHAL